MKSGLFELIVSDRDEIFVVCWVSNLAQALFVKINQSAWLVHNWDLVHVSTVVMVITSERKYLILGRSGAWWHWSVWAHGKKAPTMSRSWVLYY